MIPGLIVLTRAPWTLKMQVEELDPCRANRQTKVGGGMRVREKTKTAGAEEF